MSVILTPEQRADIRAQIDAGADIHPRVAASLLASDETQAQQISAALALHREAHNEHDPRDGWPSGHCNTDGMMWPCPTAHALGVTS